MLRLLLNSLYAISKELYPQEIIKGAFELRAMAMSGYAPDLGACSVCGTYQDEHFYLHIMNGSLLCSECFSAKGKEIKKFSDTSYDDIRQSETVVGLTPAVCAAMRYVLSAPLERLFAFELEEATDLDDFARATQTYTLSHLERGFDSLNFYLTMRAPMPHKENKV
jgi:DNA repair protein RecO (recombination protein O)